MNELITLNPTEQFLANTNMTMTLKDVADNYLTKNKTKLQHSKIVKSFEIQVSELSADRFDTMDFWVSMVDVQTGKGKIEKLKTYGMNLKTMVWFIAKFDADLRADIINFAFEKLQQEKTLAVLEAKKPKLYSDGKASVRRCSIEAWTEDEEAPTEHDIWNALVWKGFVVTKAKATTIRTINPDLEGHIGNTKGVLPTFNPLTVRKVVSEWIESGSPVKSEYERLVEEFNQISEYYKEKIEQAK